MFMSVCCSAPDFVTRLQEVQRQTCNGRECTKQQTKTQPRRDIAHPKKAIAKSIDHVKERVQVADLLPNQGQRMNRIEHARQEGHGHDHKILERRQLIKLFCPQACDQTQGAQEGGAQNRKDHNP